MKKRIRIVLCAYRLSSATAETATARASLAKSWSAERLLSDMGIESFAITDPFYPLPMQDLEDTVLIALSVSGETAGMISMLGGYKKKHAKIISITNTGQCTLAKMSDINFAYYIPLSYSWPRRDTAEQTTQIPPLYLLETLMRKICEKRKQSSEN